jgi:transposase-like protein
MKPIKRNAVGRVVSAITAGAIAVGGFEFVRSQLGEKMRQEAIEIAREHGISEATLDKRRRAIWDEMGISRPPERKAAQPAFYLRRIHKFYEVEEQILNEVKSGKLIEKAKPVNRPKNVRPDKRYKKPQVVPSEKTYRRTVLAQQKPRSGIGRRNA